MQRATRVNDNRGDVLVLLYVIASWAIVTGVVEVLAAVRLRREITDEWLLGLSGVLSVVFGLLLIIFPRAGALTVVWLIGVYALVFGVVLVGLALRLRGRSQEGIRSRGLERPSRAEVGTQAGDEAEEVERCA
jgi:hypothetical protein